MYHNIKWGSELNQFFEVSVTYNTEIENDICMNFYEPDYEVYEKESKPITEYKPIPDREFLNPNKERPMETKNFLKFMFTDVLENEVESMYDPNYKSFRFPPMAGLRTLIYMKLKKYKFLTQAYNDLQTIPDLPEILGYEDGYIPSYRQLHKFTNKTLGVKGIKKLFDKMVKEVMKEGLKHGLKIGEEIMVDASPIKACPKDPDARINGHYLKTMKIGKCYLWHNMRCLETRVPLVFHLNHGNDDEGKFLLPMLMKAKHLGVPFKKLYIDCGYSTKENIASAKVFYNINISTNISKAWEYNSKATPQEINNQYQKLWKTAIYRKNGDQKYKEMALIMMNDGKNNRLHKLVGDLYRNDIIAKHEECPDGYLDDNHQRNGIESTHGTEKRIGNITETEVRGLAHNTIQMGLHLLTLLFVAHTRLINGVTKDLTDTAYII